jgi:antitoxin component of MazEF toxin-antitoxin module
MMSKTLVKHGDDYAIVLDKALMETLGIRPDTPLDFATDGNCLIVAPSAMTRDAKFRAAMDDTFKKYGRMLKRLAE